MTPSSVPAGVRFGVVRGISYGLFGPPDRFAQQARDLGAGIVRAYLYWGQVEPEPGRYAWDVVDALLEQFDGAEELWITVCSSSTWATRQSTTFLPPSPAKDPDAYHRFVRRLVEHCAGRVRYWQCDNEPSNVGLLWSGTAEEYLAQLRLMARAVRETDPNAVVVLGGAPFGLPVSPPDAPDRRFFDLLLREGRDHFDVFDLHLYGPVERIPADIEAVRGLMRAHGYDRPVVAGEYNGPWPELYPEATAAMQQVLAAAFAAGPDGADGTAPGGEDGAGESAGPQTPEQRAMSALYDQRNSLPATLQMFMAGAPEDLVARRQRINAREIVTRNVLALSAGVRRTVCWNLGPEVPGYQQPLSVMDLMFGRFALMEYQGRELCHRHPSGEAFARMTRTLAGVQEVVRLHLPDRPDLYAFDVRRQGRGPLLVVWDHRDSFHGEDQPAVPFEWPWSASAAGAVDALGEVVPVELEAGRIRLAVSVTPVFVEAGAGT